MPPSLPGLLLATAFFAASLTPSLIPRTSATQALLTGCAAAAGYGLGAFAGWLWVWLGLPAPQQTRVSRWTRWAVIPIAAVIGWALWRTPGWQNMVRDAMGLPDVGGLDALRIGLLAIVVFAVILACARLLRQLVRRITRRFRRRLPRRLANTMGLLTAGLLLVLLANGLLFRVGLRALDSSYREADALIPPETAPPREPDGTGSPESLVAWDRLGRMGREFVSAAPTAAQIAEFTQAPTQRPLRVYVGLTAADSARARAQLALDELKRVGGFSRKALVVITPTGTGWVDPAAITPLEYLCRGDVASVAVQYSYVSSPLSLLLERDYGRQTAQALFDAVYAYWRTLPKENRPKLYLFGLSLGAFHSEQSVQLFELLGDPIDGALWSGPPFASQHWRSITRHRNAGTPAWRPAFRDGAFVRFMNHGDITSANAPWGPMRVVYLQYASDAVTFFSYDAFFHEPAWMHPPRGADVSRRMHWYPIVTGMQLTVDMLLANRAPMGHGHVYAPADYLAAWLAITGIDDWTRQELQRLGESLDARRAKSIEEDEGSG